ncbi:phthiocerol/phthiodiolone dimycocerosyl transferase family protein [Nocardioides stalactiti]|uniref:phthiocerol/phthiodiolone dimycocerosyl transferase family protein n=1 Tax=Nocardioides stalactiti TaxID=2755356 RepID=UPI001601A8A7|nr:hypothetical protein [Nocardioides stalactiti]
MTSRPLDPTEIYYEVVDRLWPMNALGFIEVAGDHDPAQVHQAWARLTAQVPVIGARVVRGGPREAEIDFAPHLLGDVTPYPDQWTMLAAVGDERIDLDGPLVRCATAPASAGGTAIAVTAHHVALDGRPMAQLLLLLSRVLVDGDDVSGHPLTAPTEGLGTYALPERDWGTRRTQMLATAREVRDEDGYVGNGGVPGWYDRALEKPRDLAFTIFDLEIDEASALLAWAKANGATVHGALTAIVLKAMSRLAPELERIPLSTTVDLRVRAAEPAVDAVGQSAAVVSASFDPTQETGALAREASADIRRRVDRGEPELFFALSGVDKLPVGETTDKVVRRWMETGTPAANLSNLGIVTADAPASVRRMCVSLAPTPNQVLFVTATTFRGRVTLIQSFDRNRLSITPEQFTEILRAEVAALTEEAPRP